MNHLKEKIVSDLKSAGACAVGVAEACPVETGEWERFQAWLARGDNGPLGYMHNYPALRRDPRELLSGARSIVCAAWPYLPPTLRDPSLPFLARYAYAPDYHKTLRRLLKPLLRSWTEFYASVFPSPVSPTSVSSSQRTLSAVFRGEAPGERVSPPLQGRICIDSAPVLERYWAVKAGLGFVGRNRCLIVPGVGSWVFLSEILLTAPLPPDSPCTLTCCDCGACLAACPAAALTPDGIDCRRCHSALTVEAPGSLASPDLPCTAVFRGEAPEERVSPPLAGCDRCQEVCPHNRGARPTTVGALQPLPQILTLTAAELRAMTPDGFAARYGASSLSRMGLTGLLANLPATTP